jgi:hypothetical protein
LYSWITGITEEDEKGRVKAWDIAIDAQLTGGDAEVSKSRLVLTFFAAGTLPRSPARMMLKALHCRILLWRVGDSGSITCRLSNKVAYVLAKYQWQLAQQMQKSLPKGDEDGLPDHLAALLEMDIEEVMTDAILQRAVNMTWNRSTQEATNGDDAMLDVVVEDMVVRSPLDTLAAWWSSHILQNALIHRLEFNAAPSLGKKGSSFESNIELAVNSAPYMSAAYVRASVVKAVFIDQDRVANINPVLAALPRSKHKSTISSTNFLDSSIPPSARTEISMAVRCAMIAAILKEQVTGDASPTSPLTFRNAITLFNQLPVDPVELTLLGFASIFHLLHIVTAEERSTRSYPLSSPSSSPSLISSLSSPHDEKSEELSLAEIDNLPLPIPDVCRIASGLVYWVRNAYNPVSYGFTAKLRDQVVEECVAVCRSVGVEITVGKNEWEQVYRQKKHSKKSNRGDGGEAKHRSHEFTTQDQRAITSRRTSVKSNDTGYESLDQEDSGEGISPKIAPEVDDILAKQEA